jgi:hypothetical protein
VENGIGIDERQVTGAMAKGDRAQIRRHFFIFQNSVSAETFLEKSEKFSEKLSSLKLWTNFQPKTKNTYV